MHYTTAQNVSVNVLNWEQTDCTDCILHSVYIHRNIAGNIDPLDIIDRLARNHVVWMLLYNILVPV